MATKNTGSPNRGSQDNKPSARSSKKPRKPVTIDLEPTRVVSAAGSKATNENVQKSTVGKNTKPGTKPAAVAPSLKSVDTKPTADSTSNDKSGTKSNPAQKSNVAQKATPSADPTEKISNSQIGTLMAGIVGGVIALAGAFLLQQSGIISPGNTNSASNAEFTAEITRIDETLNSLANKQNTATNPDLSALTARIGELEAAQKINAGILARQNTTIENVNTTTSGLAESVEQATITSRRLEQSISSGSAGENAALATLDERLKALEENISNTGAVSDEIKALKSRLDELVDQIAQPVATDPLKTDDLLKEISAEIADLSQKLASVTQNAGDSQSAADEKFTEITNSFVKLQQTLTDLGARLDSVEVVAATPQKDEQRVARALAVVGLKSAIDSGGNFEGALALMKSLGSNTTATEPLNLFAASGVPTLSALESTFSLLADKIIASDVPAGEKGVVDKLFANMRSLVKIRSTGAMVGNSPLAIVSRIKDGLKSSDLKSVITEWEQLPDAAKAISMDWVQSVKARQTTNTLIENLLNKFMTGASVNGN